MNRQSIRSRRDIGRVESRSRPGHEGAPRNTISGVVVEIVKTTRKERAKFDSGDVIQLGFLQQNKISG